jgi:hypothetical protein
MNETITVVATKSTSSNLEPLIDALGDIRARIAELEKKETEIKNALKELEPGAYEGERYRLTVTLADREKLDMEAVREKLSAQFLRAHTTVFPVRTLRTVGVARPVEEA